jgi:hypothetical protein
MTIQIKQTSFRWVFSALLLIIFSIVLSGCITPEITDPDWQARDNIKTQQPSSPPPPKQWDWNQWNSQ